MATPKAILQAALAGGPVERMLLAPLACAVAGEVEGLAPRAFLRNATKLANTLRDLQRGLGLDLVVAESGAHLELEALGAALDWSGYPPRVIAPPRLAPQPSLVPPDLERRGRLPILLDAVSRLKPVLGDRAAVAVALSGPQRLCTASAGTLSLAAAAELVLAVVRLVCARGVDLVWLLEEGASPPAAADGWAAATGPIWGTIRFYQAVPALHLPGAADGWRPVVEELGGAAVPCVDPVQSPALAAAVAGAGPYGAVAAPEAIAPPGAGNRAVEALRRFVSGPGCLLVTSDADWYGRVPARELGVALRSLKEVIPG